MEGIKELFVRTFWGLTRSHSVSQDKFGSTSQGNFFGRVLGSQTPNTSIIYTTPYLAAKSDLNTSSVFAYKRIFGNQRPVAVLGYEMDMESFVTDQLVKNTQCLTNGPECDISCDRSGKNSHEGLYCYLLDENGFVVAGNEEKFRW
ncbi:Voltage-dependent calcium channel subunit alpha-2/delta-4 [Desmophyllum pertusum]|uniref:Voltage-dependent calcium channel subunit alpha-2/delta-4 n=1 Tax=Desmophyllum pertusum TaxID=174260 RepID=A0A9W9YVJ8_9CNID|nr:Voltage-dependent calcium channel subunit alpha-2/delta-4 [Desmophyllum pertusum]